MYFMFNSMTIDYDNTTLVVDYSLPGAIPMVDDDGYDYLHYDNEMLRMDVDGNYCWYSGYRWCCLVYLGCAEPPLQGPEEVDIPF